MTRSRNTSPSRAISSPSGSDFLQLTIDDAPPRGRCEWLTEQLRLAIADGRLPIGATLPATRTLAADLRVSRGVVTEAYQRLVEDGHVAGHGRGGTTVVAAPIGTRPPRATPRAVRPSNPFTGPPEADVFDAVRAAPARIDLTPGVPDLAAFPRAAWMRAERAVLDGLSAADFGYGDPRGAPALRAEVATWLARNRGIRVEPAEVVIVAGVAQALALFARVFRDQGIDRIAVEDPSSLGARQHLNHWGLTTPPIAVDSAGLDVEELRASGAPAALLTPAHQFPTGVVLDGERRRELLRWAEEGGVIVEDDYDAEHRYGRAPVPALRSRYAERICYAGSVSKWLAPALRIGWLLAPPEYFDAVVSAKRFTDLGSPVLAQLVLAHLMRSGEMERQLRFVRTRHRRRRDAMAAAIAEHLPGAVVHGVAAGLHLTVTWDTGPDDVELAEAALASGVKVQPLSWHRQRPGPPGLVLGYGARTPTDIADAVATLGALR
ncbi:PLP-dependent aminotransferase family protein [Pseudonocardia spinosispora]|uniref:MocR-like pyridoxine biosynthesis transcription factor PdxR n=1 Tax=Pseudonocardia spinosispora TaxID=103441 RepID=UPI0003FCF180|nr:PLP-dependent aminotransferase family protein [Pseudonocardia spinosispora]